MRRRLVWALGGSVAMALAVVLACGIEDGGILDGPGTDGQALPDGYVVTGDGPGLPDVVGLDVALPPSCGDAAPCLGAVPDMWQIVAVLGDPDASCPKAYTTTDLVTGFALSAGACVCSCGDQGVAACGLSQLSCGNDGAKKCTEDPNCDVGDGGCNPLTDNKGNWVRASKPPMTGITCGVAQTTVGVDFAPIRVCEPTCAAGDFCSTAMAASAKPCIIFEGDVACPTYQTFTKQLLGSSATGICNGCAGCNSPVGLFCNGTMAFYGDNMCATDASFSLSTSGTCVAGPGGNSGSAITVTTTPPAGPFCTGLSKGGGGGMAGPVGPKTLCCP